MLQRLSSVPATPRMRRPPPKLPAGNATVVLDLPKPTLKLPTLKRLVPAPRVVFAVPLLLVLPTLSLMVAAVMWLLTAASFHVTRLRLPLPAAIVPELAL